MTTAKDTVEDRPFDVRAVQAPFLLRKREAARRAEDARVQQLAEEWALAVTESTRARSC